MSTPILCPKACQDRKVGHTAVEDSCTHVYRGGSFWVQVSFNSREACATYKITRIPLPWGLPSSFLFSEFSSRRRGLKGLNRCRNSPGSPHLNVNVWTFYEFSVRPVRLNPSIPSLGRLFFRGHYPGSLHHVTFPSLACASLGFPEPGPQSRKLSADKWGCLCKESWSFWILHCLFLPKKSHSSSFSLADSAQSSMSITWNILRDSVRTDLPQVNHSHWVTVWESWRGLGLKPQVPL